MTEELKRYSGLVDSELASMRDNINHIANLQRAADAALRERRSELKALRSAVSDLAVHAQISPNQIATALLKKLLFYQGLVEAERLGGPSVEEAEASDPPPSLFE